MKKIVVTALLSLGMFMTASVRADVRMTLYVYSDCVHCQNARQYFDDTFQYIYPMLHVTVIDMDRGLTAMEMESFQAAWQGCGLENPGLPIFVVNDKCVQGYGPIEESHPDLQNLVEPFLTADERDLARTNRAAMDADPDAFRARINADNPDAGGMPAYWYVVLAGIMIIGLGIVAGRRIVRKNK